MNADTPSRRESVPEIALIRPDQVEPAAELFRVQLEEHRIEIDSAEIRRLLETIVADGRYGFILVAIAEGGMLVGVAFCSAILSMEHGGLSGWLEELYVLPRWRQMGLGTRLVSEVLRIAETRGWRALDLEVESDHRRVISLYDRFGFLPHSRSRFYRKLGS